MKSQFDFPNKKEYEKYLRAYFASQVMQGFIASNRTSADMETNISICIQYADILINQLNQTKP